MANYTLKKFGELESTSAKAKEMAAQGAKPWTVVTALQQNQGYGRKGNAWYSPEGGLYFSVVLPKSNIEDLQTMTILAAYCVANTVKEQLDVEPMIKLPNDVYLNGKKVCGILTENVVEGEVRSSVIGIGVNTNTDYFPADLEAATSLKKELGRTIDNDQFLEQIISQLQNVFKSISQ
ncbi:MAG: biotin--[acetyl-CoA-carboxylase] ligase [Candidatus Pacebacteria bacterium]|nr:biotin--[acetyl-CoA-carboxylase] ligase [Candidatus Paceibacterota bacterium]